MNVAWMMVAYAFALLGQLGDCWTTEVGTNHGLVESNSVVKWLVSKIGDTGVTLLKCIGLAQVFPVVVFELMHQDVTTFVIAASAAGVIGWVAAIKNYLLLKKNGIKL